MLRFIAGFALIFLAGFSVIVLARLQKAQAGQKLCDAVISKVGPDVLLVVDPDRTILRCSASIKKVFGYEVEEVVNQKTDLLYPDRRLKPGQKYEIHHILELEGLHTGVATGKRKDGELIPLEISASLIGSHPGAILVIRDISKRRRAEEALRRDRDFISNVLETAGCFVLILDRESRVVRANRAFERATGRTLNEVRGRYFWDLFLDPAAVKPLKSVFDKLSSTEFPIYYEHTIETKEGVRRVTAWSSTLMVDSEDSAEYIVCTGIDVTERARVEAKLRDSERFHRAVLQSEEEPILIVDTKGGLIGASGKAAELTGYRPEQLLEMDIARLCIPEDVGRVQADLREVIQKGPRRIGEAGVLRKDGTVLPALMTGRNMEYDGRTAVRIAIREMTAGRRLSQSTEEAQACHSESFVEHAQDLMWSLDERLRLSAANAAFRMFFLLLYGIRISPGMMLMNYVPGEVRALVASMYNRGVRGEETRVEHRFNFNGAAVDVEIACSPVITDERTIVGASFVARDVTDRRKREEDIRISLRDKDVLMQEAYHRIKNNLQVIASLLNIQAERVRDKESLDMFKESLNRVKTMSLIHENLYRAKDFTRIDFGEYMRTLVDYLFRAYGANVTRIKSRVSSPAVVMEVNQAMSCGLIVNELVSNSLKYAFPSNIEGEVYVEVRPRDDGYVTLVAGDTGVGLPKDVEIKQTKSMGLQLVNSLVNQLKGTIVLQDKAGTEFMITFPVLPSK